MKVYWLSFTIAIAGLAAEPVSRTPEIPMPAAFREISPSTGITGKRLDAAQWWKQFDDPVLESLVERAARNNLDVRSAASRVAEARAASGRARSALMPEVRQAASISRIRGGFSQGPGQRGETAFRSSCSPGSREGRLPGCPA